MDQSPVHLYDPVADFVNAELSRRSTGTMLYKVTKLKNAIE